VKKPFVYNGDFDVLVGEEFFVNGQLCFPPGPEKPDGGYRSIFGPSAAHTGVINSANNGNMGLAMQRLTCKRAPETPGKHEQLFENQANFVANHIEFIARLRHLYSRFFEDYEGAEIEALLHHADPHEKRELRICAHLEMVEECINIDQNSPWSKSVLWKMKTDEWAKLNAWPRSIGDLGVVASLLGFRLTHFLKSAQSEEPIHVNGGDIVFCKTPDPFQLEKHFENLLNPPGRFYFLYFSDDSCLAIRRADGSVDWYNLDIKSCDSSHGPSIFDVFKNVFPEGHPRHDAMRLIAQCCLPLRVVSRVDKRHVLIIRPKRPMLYSGSTITTGINNLANILIALSISECVYTGAVGVNGESIELIEAAERVGYMLTGCFKLEVFEDIQFLKNSPVKDKLGRWKPMLNFGVLVRASGTCKGDLPGRGDLEMRARAFQSGLIQGCYPYTRSEVISSMRNATGCWEEPTERMKDDLRYKVDFDSKFPPYDVDEASFCARYRLDAADYSSLLNDFARMGYGESYHGGCLSKILEKDYGLTTCEFDNKPYLNVTYHSPTTEAIL